MRIFIILLLLICGCSFEPTNEQYTKQRDELKNELAWARYYLEQTTVRKRILENEIKTLIVDKAIKQGTEKYILTLKVYKDSLSFADDADSIKFEIMVDKGYYNSVQMNETIHKQMAYSSFHELKVKVIDKKITD